MSKYQKFKESMLKVMYPNILFKDGSVNKKQVYKKIIEQVRERNLICAVFLFFIQLFFFIKYINEGFYAKVIRNAKFNRFINRSIK